MSDSADGSCPDCCADEANRLASSDIVPAVTGDGNCVAEDTMLSSNFAGALLLLERAFVALHGKDELSICAREALSLLIAARLGTETPQSA